MALPWYTVVYHGSTMVWTDFTMVPQNVPWYTMVGSMVYHGKIQCTVVLPWYRLFIPWCYRIVPHHIPWYNINVPWYEAWYATVYHGSTMVCTDFTMVPQHVPWYTIVGSMVYHGKIQCTVVLPWYRL